MPSEHVIDKEVDDAVVDMLADMSFTEFNPLRDNDVKLKACVHVRMNKDGEDMPPKGDPVSLKRLSPVEKVFTDLDYILIVDNSAWKTASSRQAQDAIIHRGLMKMQVEMNDGKLKLATRKPDIVEFTETVVRFGSYNAPLLNLREAMVSASKRAVTELHGKI